MIADSKAAPTHNSDVRSFCLTLVPGYSKDSYEHFIMTYSLSIACKDEDRGFETAGN